eukprot:8466403-Pyramimonas_sp.AAC.1
MTRKERWFSLCKTIGCRYLEGIAWTQSKGEPHGRQKSVRWADEGADDGTAEGKQRECRLPRSLLQGLSG